MKRIITTVVAASPQIASSSSSSSRSPLPPKPKSAMSSLPPSSSTKASLAATVVTKTGKIPQRPIAMMVEYCWQLRYLLAIGPGRSSSTAQSAVIHHWR